MSTLNSHICLTCGYGGSVKSASHNEAVPCPECNGFFADKFYAAKYKDMNKAASLDGSIQGTSNPNKHKSSPKLQECEHNYRVLSKGLYNNVKFYCSKCLNIRSIQL